MYAVTLGAGPGRGPGERYPPHASVGLSGSWTLTTAPSARDSPAPFRLAEPGTDGPWPGTRLAVGDG
jgi:hypothetical protein